VATSEPNDVRSERESELLRAELERRLAWMDDADESEFGGFTRLDWWICGVCFCVLPLLMVWWLA